MITPFASTTPLTPPTAARLAASSHRTAILPWSPPTFTSPAGIRSSGPFFKTPPLSSSPSSVTSIYRPLLFVLLSSNFLPHSSAMSGLTKLGLSLLLVFSLSLLGFFTEILYVLWRRRRLLLRSSAASGDPELPSVDGRGGDGDPSSNELLLYFLCWKNQSRVEPASSTTASPAFSATAAHAAPPAATTKTVSLAAEECEMARWRAICLGPSRVLYTIKEEREEVESDGGMGITGAGDGDEVAETPFSTPCASPPFFTPTSSPPRASTEADKDPVAPSGGEEAGAVLPAAERV